MKAREAYQTFVKKWTKLCLAVARSLAEAGEQLLTFYDFPKAMWRSLRTTNSVENLNREFRRRTKTQASFSSEESALTLLYGWSPSGRSACAGSTATRMWPASSRRARRSRRETQ